MSGAAVARVAWVALGSNVGDRPAALRALRDQLGRDGALVSGASTEVVTRPVGLVRQRQFLNQVVRLTASRDLHPVEWLRLCQDAERAAGRRVSYRWGPRRGDADILLLGDDGEVTWEDAELTVPHPALGERPFLWPLLREAGYTGSRSAS